MITISLIKADIGSFPGHTRAPQKLIDKCKEYLEEVKGQLI
ncbi:MAG: fructose 1,6-bisphosphatase, partial [Clostridia bacterium]|nr:fructose 1,6-bisphosphatase [Clostridia bacterium]